MGLLPIIQYRYLHEKWHIRKMSRRKVADDVMKYLKHEEVE